MVKFFAIGPPKCGTTSLQNILIQNPYIYLSLKKEIQFFNYNYEKGYAWYHSHFKDVGTNQVAGEISPTYCDSIETLKKIKTYMEDTGNELKIILTIRDPLKRLLSEYQHNIRRANYNMPILEAINIEKSGKKKGKYYNIVRNSKYYEILSDVYSLFDKKNVLIINSDEELFNSNNIRNTIKKIEDFIGASNKENYNFDIEDNASYVPKSYAVQKMVFHNRVLKTMFRFLIPSFKFRERFRSIIRKINTQKTGYEKSKLVPKQESDFIYETYLKDDFENFKKLVSNINKKQDSDLFKHLSV